MFKDLSIIDAICLLWFGLACGATVATFICWVAWGRKEKKSIDWRNNFWG